jgi:hypothetical protein
MDEIIPGRFNNAKLLKTEKPSNFVEGFSKLTANKPRIFSIEVSHQW